MFYPMLADIYYGEETQLPSGRMQKTWALSESVPCELKTGSFNTEMRYALQTYDEFFFIPTIVYGRFSKDIQELTNGTSKPFSELRVTNLRRNSCDGEGEVLFTEDVDGVQTPVIYEVRSLSPFVNPWGRAEHWKTQLIRSDNQQGAL